MLTVLPPFHTFTTDAQMIEDTPDQYKARMQQHAEKTLSAMAQVAKAAGVFVPGKRWPAALATSLDGSARRFSASLMLKAAPALREDNSFQSIGNETGRLGRARTAYAATELAVSSLRR